MSETVSVPETLVGSFKRMMRRVPTDLRNDENMPATILAYLKLGGEKLAKQALMAMNETQRFETAIKRRKLREEMLLKAAESRNLEAEEKGDEEDREDETDTEFDSEDRDPDEDLEVF